MAQNDLCDYFTSYTTFPQQAITTEALLDSPRLKLIKSDNKIYFGEVDRKRREGRGLYFQRDGKLYEG
jgi:ribosomal protein L13E